MFILLSRSVAQTGHASNDLLKCSLLHDSLQVEESSFTFNNLNFINTGGARLDIEIYFTTPDFIDIISGKEIKANIDAGQNRIIPFRFAFTRKSIAVDWYPVTAEIRVRQTGAVIKKVFYIRPKENNNWRASLKQSSITFTGTDKEIVFEILLQNTGNSADTYKISFETGLRLDQAKKNLAVHLQPGAKTTVPVRILLNPAEMQVMSRQEVDVTIRSKNGEQKLMKQTIALIGHLYTGISERWNKMPLSLELNMMNLAGGQPFAYLNAMGYINLNDNARLSLQYQSNHYYKDISVNSQIARVEYEKGNLRLGLGSIVDFNQFLIDGVGAKFNYTGKNESTYEITGVRARTGQSLYYNAKIHRAWNEKINISSNIIANQDRAAKLNSYLALNRLDWTVNQSTKISIEAGAGTEQIERLKLDTSLHGLQWGYLIEKTGKNYQLRSNISWFSKNFPGFGKGSQNQLHEARWFSDKLSAGVYMENNHRSYNNAADSSVKLLFNIRTMEYGFRAGFKLPKGSIVFSPGVLTQKQDSMSAIEAKMYKIGLNANYQFSEKMSLSLYSNAGHVLLDKYPPNIKSINSITNMLTFQAHSYGFNVRYDEGPYYYYEIKQFINTPVRFRKIQVSPFLEVPVKKWNLSYRFQLNYLKETDRPDLYLLYNNLQYSSGKKGLDIGITGQWNVKGNDDPFVNLVIRKKLKVPVFKNRNSSNVDIRLFIDNNADGKFNEQDEPVQDALVVAGEACLMTNKEGIIEFRNVERKVIKIDLSHISHLRGWIPKGGYNQVVTPGSGTTQYIAFSKSKVVSGRLLLIRDSKSSLTMDLEAIRMIAVNRSGETFSALTNASGEFFFNLPAGDYTVTINQAVFDDNFRPVETTKLADLVNNDQLNLQFEIRQKKRQLNLHKQ
jgi:hypothetical protein